MKQKILNRTISGILIGHAICFIIYAIISIFIIKDGRFYHLQPGLADKFGGEIPATIVQAILITVFGAVYGISGLVYEREDWGVTKQTAIHFAVLVSLFLIIGGILRWYPFTFAYIIQGVVIFSALYFLIWAAIYRKIKKDIERVNNRIAE